MKECSDKIENLRPTRFKKSSSGKDQDEKKVSNCNKVCVILEHFKKSYLIQSDDKNNSIPIAIPLFEEFCNSAIKLSTLYQAVLGDNFVCKILNSDIVNNTRDSLSAWIKESRDSKTVEEFLKSQIEIHTLNGIESNHGSGVVKFLWVVRSVNFIFNFIENVAFVSEENLYESILDAYNRSLRPYHGFTKHTIAMMAIRLVPSKTKLISNLGFSDIETGINSLREFISISRPCISRINFLMEKYQCNFKHIV